MPKEKEIQEAKEMLTLLKSSYNSGYYRHILNTYNNKLWGKISNNEELNEHEKEFVKLKYWQEEARAGLL